MFRGNKARNLKSPRATSSWRGRFLDGVWHCDCEPRLPADRFQTKNGGVNHGRWFYTCQKPQHQRCKFFLWEDQAQAREKAIVLSNSRSEADALTKTPSKTTQSRGGLLTPTTGSRHSNIRRDVETSPSKGQRRKDSLGSDDSFSWDEDLDEEMERILDRPPKQPNFSPETPRKTPRTATISSPGKRKLADTEQNSPTKLRSSTQTSAEPSSTPGTLYPLLPSSLLPSSIEFSTTPTPRRYTNVLSANPSLDVSDLSAEVLKLLDQHDVVLPTQARDELVAVLDKHDLKTQGIIRGREVSRLALRKKDEEIKELNQRIEGLATEKEMGRAIISGFKMEPMD